MLGPAIAIAVLGAIESLLCAVVADGLTRTKHNPNSELVGQGLGNLVAPFFGGITATAALARTATNIRSGARSPIAALVHSLVVLLSVLVLAGLLGKVPMAALAALLFIVAWNMSEARHFFGTARTAPRGDVVILLVCFGLTVLFDMVIAVAVGVGLAAVLFIQRMAELTEVRALAREMDTHMADLPDQVAVFSIEGPLFFGVAERAIGALRSIDPKIKILVLDMQRVPSMDGTAIVALQSLVVDLHQSKVSIILAGLAPRIIAKLRRAGIRRSVGRLMFASDREAAAKIARRWCAKQGSDQSLQ